MGHKTKSPSSGKEIEPSKNFAPYHDVVAVTTLGGRDFFPAARASASSLSSYSLIMPPKDFALVSHTPMMPMRMAARYGVDAANDPRDTIRI